MLNKLNSLYINPRKFFAKLLFNWFHLNIEDFLSGVQRRAKWVELDLIQLHPSVPTCTTVLINASLDLLRLHSLAISINASPLSHSTLT